MTEMDPREMAIDDLLRRAYAAPGPSLPPDFDQRVLRELNPSTRLDRFRRIWLTGYALVSVATSAIVLRGQGLDWPVVTMAILGPLAAASGLLWAGAKPATASGNQRNSG